MPEREYFGCSLLSQAHPLCLKSKTTEHQSTSYQTSAHSSGPLSCKHDTRMMSLLALIFPVVSWHKKKNFYLSVMFATLNSLFLSILINRVIHISHNRDKFFEPTQVNGTDSTITEKDITLRSAVNT